MILFVLSDKRGYITFVILGLKYVEIDTEISPIARIQPEIWKVMLKFAWLRIWRSTVKKATNIH